MKFTLFDNVMKYFKSSQCSRTFIYTVVLLMVFSAISYSSLYFFKQNKKGVSVGIAVAGISLIFLINFIYDMGKSRVEAPKVSSPSPIQKPKIKVEEVEEVKEIEPQPDNESENFAIY